MPVSVPTFLRPGAVERIFGRILASLVRIGLVGGQDLIDCCHSIVAVVETLAGLSEE